MPVYEHECDKCGDRTDRVLTIAGRDLCEGSLCDKCEGGRLHRLVSEVHFRLKGRGWAADGYSHNVGDIEKHTGKDFIATPVE